MSTSKAVNSSKFRLLVIKEVRSLNNKPAKKKQVNWIRKGTCTLLRQKEKTENRKKKNFRRSRSDRVD